MNWTADLLAVDSCFATLSAAHAPFADHAQWPTLAEYTESLAAIRTGSGLTLVPVRDTKPRRRHKGLVTLCDRYDGRIFFRGELPTRLGSWHDHFNLLAWRAFPQFKAAINTAQVEEIIPLFETPRETMPEARSKRQDRLAMIDEGGIILAAPHALWLERPAVIEQEPQWLQERTRQGDLDVQIFGHAFYEHVILGRPLPVRGFPLVVPINTPRASVHYAHALDAALAAEILRGAYELPLAVAVRWPLI